MEKIGGSLKHLAFSHAIVAVLRLNGQKHALEKRWMDSDSQESSSSECKQDIFISTIHHTAQRTMLVGCEAGSKRDGFVLVILLQRSWVYILFRSIEQ